MKNKLYCPCGAEAKDNSKERGRFLRRHLVINSTNIADPTWNKLSDLHSDFCAKQKAKETK